MLKPIRVQGRVDVEMTPVISLRTTPRADYVAGQPLIINSQRYVITRREDEPAGTVLLALRRETTGRKTRRANRA